MLKVTIRGLKKLKRDSTAENKRQKKALNTAVKVEPIKTARKIKKEIRSSNVGKQKFAPLSFLARRSKGKRLRPDKPLSALARAVHYHVQKSEPYQVAIGFTGPRLSTSWKKIAKKQQEGFAHDMTDLYQRKMREVGGELGKRAMGRKYLFLRDEKRVFKTPARPIIEPFLKVNRNEILGNIRDNFKRKMRGEKI